MKLEEFVTKALSVPFVPHGRDFGGWDCWGVIVAAYRETRGVELPSYASEYGEADLQGTEELSDHIRRVIPRWHQVSNPQPMDVAVFLIAGRPVHVGLMVDVRHALHAEERAGTFVERINSAMWRDRLEGVYRYAP